MKDVIRSLERNEPVTILYHGKVKGTIMPVQSQSGSKVQNHSFFGMRIDDKRSVNEVMDKLRGARYRDI
jgi:hypothetical protein